MLATDSAFRYMVADCDARVLSHLSCFSCTWLPLPPSQHPISFTFFMLFSKPYVPTWHKLVSVIGHKEFVYIADCKAASQGNRAQIDAAGWRIYATNATLAQLPLSTAVAYYREQWQLERGFHRFKRGSLPALPIYLQNEQRIIGLMFLLTLALRVFTLIEFVVQRQLQGQSQGLMGLYDGNPKRTTHRPTAERLLAAFCHITLYHYRDGTFEITPLDDLHKNILSLMAVPQSVYDLTQISSLLEN